MGNVPDTSISMLKALSKGTDNVRWTEFFRKYESTMRGFLRARFPSVDPEDAMQETLLALMKALPNYHYTPDKKLHFRNYLVGVLAHKAMDILKHEMHQSDVRERLKAEPHYCAEADCTQEEIRHSLRVAAMEAAIEQLMCDETINPTTREVFRHVALMHEKPDAVATQFGVSRNNVDQIKKRMIGKLSEMVRRMEEFV